MKKNMGTADKGIRLLIAIGIALLYYFDVIEGTLAYVLMALAIVFLLTSFINFCPLYKIFGINTLRKSTLNRQNILEKILMLSMTLIDL